MKKDNHTTVDFKLWGVLFKKDKKWHPTPHLFPNNKEAKKFIAEYQTLFEQKRLYMGDFSRLVPKKYVDTMRAMEVRAFYFLNRTHSAE